VIILIIHEIISCIQYLFSFNFFNSVSSPLVVVAMLVKIFGTLDWESTKDSSGGHDTENLNLWYLVPKIFYGVNNADRPPVDVGNVGLTHSGDPWRSI